MSIAVRSGRQVIKQVDDQNLSGCCVTSFGLIARVSCWSPIGACPGGFHALTHIYSVAAATLGFRFCLCLVFHRETESFIVIVSISPFTVIQGPRSWSPLLCRLVLWNWVLEPHIYPCFIYICNFRCMFLLSCLCSSIRLQEKPSRRGQSSYAWLITNRAAV